MSEHLIVSIADDMKAAHVGNKAYHLKQCHEWGCRVPAFVVIPTTSTRSVFGDQSVRASVVKAALSELSAMRYAVRSSSLLEDDVTQSLAGQFTTCLNLSPHEVEEAVVRVLKQAEDRLLGDWEKFAIIIQEYIKPDSAGVLFTRNPLGSREMVVEYATGSGDQLVSGLIRPKKESTLWDEDQASKAKFFRTHPILSEIGKLLEKKYVWPQDIEWCLQGNDFFVLQSRPITSLTEQQYEEIVALEALLPKSGPYYFEKTEISEIAPRPVPVTLGLIQRIYAVDGPVARVYRKYHVRYQDTEFLKLLGNELYIDKERELQSLLPSWSYFGSASFRPHWRYRRGSWDTLRTLIRFNTITPRSYDSLLQAVQTRLVREVTTDDIETCWHRLLDEYQYSFEINLLAGFVMKRAERALHSEPVRLIEVLKSILPPLSVGDVSFSWPAQGLTGNSLDFADESVFHRQELTMRSSNNEVTSWWEGLPSYKQRYYGLLLSEAARYERLREIGRWLTVKNTHALRGCLLKRAQEAGFQDARHIYFASWEEILGGHVLEAMCSKKRETYLSHNTYSFPVRITSTPDARVDMQQGVSPGLARGELVSRSILDTLRDDSKARILYTDLLTPDLVRYFDRISGIVSQNGGLLSHLAIVARERGIPVVVGYSFSDGNIRYGERVEIDGSSGLVERITDSQG